MSERLEEINPKFRQLTDLLLFTDRVDLDLSNFKHLFRENHSKNLIYFLERLERSLEIAWENGEQFWQHRLSFLLSLREKGLISCLDKRLEKRFVTLMKQKSQINIQYDLPYLQYWTYCNVKRQRGENLFTAKQQLIRLLDYVSVDKMIPIILSFIPSVFRSINEFAEMITHKITQSTRYFDTLLALEKRGIEFDWMPLLELTNEIILVRPYNERNCRAFFVLLNDSCILSEIKKHYTPLHREGILEILEECDYRRIEENHLRNIKNLIELDETLADEIVERYADKLYLHPIHHKKGNINKLIRILKKFPQASSKRLLLYLSVNGLMKDIEELVKHHKELEGLVAFV